MEEFANASMPPDRAPATGHFPATRWTLVMAARGGDTSVAQRALGELCQVYWFPLYACARRRGLSPEDAEDCTQDFFQSVLERESLRTAAPEHGRLRAFLQGAMKRHMADRWRKASARKRGGGEVLLRIDQQWAEQLLAVEAGGVPPDLAFDRHWAHALMQSVTGELEEWYARLKRLDLFAALRGFLAWNQAAPATVEVAQQLKTSEEAVRGAVHTLRQRWRQLLERRITETVASGADLREEMEYLCRVLASSP